MTRGSFWTWSMSPSARTLPSCRTVTRPAIDRTKSISCSTTITECLPASDKQQLGGAFRFLRRHAGHRLVDEEQLRLLHEEHADLEPLLLPVRKRVRAEPWRSALRPMVSSTWSRWSRCSGPRRAQQRFPERLASGEGELEVLEHRQVLEHGRLLKLPADARLRDLRLGQRQQIDVPSEPGRTFIRAGLAR